MKLSRGDRCTVSRYYFCFGSEYQALRACLGLATTLTVEAREGFLFRFGSLTITNLPVFAATPLDTAGFLLAI